MGVGYLSLQDVRRDAGRFLFVFSAKDAVRDLERSRAVNLGFLCLVSAKGPMGDLGGSESQAANHGVLYVFSVQDSVRYL